ncbi:MAG: YqaJ viral recombinase family protein [Cetobacterium sp.]|nr:YqaJ viral recombinase family protein [Cetobacterium sp.]
MQNKTVKQLKLIAKEKGLKGYSKLNKSQLIELLREPTMAENFLSELPPDIEIIQYKDHDKWLETRKLGIGGSDIAAILGQNSHKCSLEVWEDKINGSEFTGNRFTHFGHKLEPVVADEFSERFPEFLISELDRTLKVNHSLANIDRLLWHPSKGYGVLECKTTSTYNAKAWEGENVPQEYYCQVMHYLAVTGLQYAYIACLIGGNDFKEFYIARNERECDHILNSCEKFWNDYIASGLQPPPDGSDAYSEYQKKKAQTIDSKIEIEIEDSDFTNKYDELSLKIKELEKEQNIIKQKWIDEMIEKNANKAIIGNKKITLITQKRESIDKKKFKEEIPNANDYITISESKFFKLS